MRAVRLSGYRARYRGTLVVVGDGSGMSVFLFRRCRAEPVRTTSELGAVRTLAREPEDFKDVATGRNYGLP